ncbi:MAG: Ig-like domain-containing protein [Clostridia bacterium]|nr:Ig-like domain-containing protein [Clostridia bacterium]
MKKFRLVLAITLAALMMISLYACGNAKENGGDNVKETENQQNEAPKVFLETLTLDDSRYSIGEFKKDVHEYIVGLPDGRPAVPRVQATAAEGVEVKISQAAIPDNKTEGKAVVTATDADGNKTTYTITFKRNIENGFVLQYDDRYMFELDDKSGAYTFESSDPDIVSVDKDGVMHAKKVADKEVTLIAKQGTVEKAKLTVDRVEKAHINLFLITGQSNGQGCYDSTNYGKNVANLIEFEDQLKLVEKIGGEGRVYSYDVYPRSQNTEVYKQMGKIYDMAVYTKQGQQASLGKAYYDLSGEKVIFLQSAYSGAPIESWLDPKRHKTEAGPYASHYFYTDTQKAYKTLTRLLGDNYEIVCTANFWCQGETAMSAVYSKKKGDYIFSTDSGFKKSDLITEQKYYEYFMMIDQAMREDFKLDYNGIMFVRTISMSNKTQIVPIISAQYALVNNNDNIFVASKKFIEIARMYSSTDKTSEGYGFIGTDNIHYNQIGHNYNGKEAAENAFKTIFGVATNVCEGIEIIAQDGVKRLTSSDTVTLSKGGTMRLGALSLPHYIDEKIVWSSNKEDVVTVDEYGVLRGVGAGTAVVTVTNESGKEQKVYVTVK